MNSLLKKRQNSLLQLLGFNIALLLFLLLSIYWIKFLKSSILEYSDIKSDPFNWTVYPISFIPNWLKSKNTNKSIDFNSEWLSIDEFIEIPKYNPELLLDSSWKNSDALLARYTYPVVYMWNYKLDYEEYAWSHPWIDIRAPLGTPVLSIANWVVIKIKNAETWDGKYVTVRHDNIKNDNSEEVYYSSYLHLSEIFVEEWTKISKWDVLWKVWMTWITTTPHLHLQIDKKNSPFHPYWPYTFKEARDIWLDFFGAVNFWLWKENAIANTINPMDFINSNLENISLNSAPSLDIKENITTTESTEIKKNDIVKENSIIENNQKNNLATNTNTEKPSSNLEVTENITKKENIPVIENNYIKENNSIQNDNSNKLIFKDIPVNSELYKTTKFLFDKKITSWYGDWTFKSKNTLTRQESLIFLFKLYNIPLDSKVKINFSDIKNNSFIVPYLQKSLELWYISNNKKFRPDDIISRAEFITILIKASWVPISNIGNTGFDDIKPTDWYSPYIETFVNTIGWAIDTNKKFQPNSTFNRWQIAQILYTIANK